MLLPIGRSAAAAAVSAGLSPTLAGGAGDGHGPWRPTRRTKVLRPSALEPLPRDPGCRTLVRAPHDRGPVPTPVPARRLGRDQLERGAPDDARRSTTVQ